MSSSVKQAALEVKEQIGPQIRPCPGTAGFSGPGVDRKHAVECTTIGLDWIVV